MNPQALWGAERALTKEGCRLERFRSLSYSFLSIFGCIVTSVNIY